MKTAVNSDYKVRLWSFHHNSYDAESALERTLLFVNTLRGATGQPPLEALPQGLRYDPTGGPVFQALSHLPLKQVGASFVLAFSTGEGNPKRDLTEASAFVRDVQEAAKAVTDTFGSTRLDATYAATLAHGPDGNVPGWLPKPLKSGSDYRYHLSVPPFMRVFSDCFTDGAYPGLIEGAPPPPETDTNDSSAMVSTAAMPEGSTETNPEEGQLALF